MDVSNGNGFAAPADAPDRIVITRYLCAEFDCATSSHGVCMYRVDDPRAGLRLFELSMAAGSLIPSRTYIQAS